MLTRGEILIYCLQIRPRHPVGLEQKGRVWSSLHRPILLSSLRASMDRQLSYIKNALLGYIDPTISSRVLAFVDAASLGAGIRGYFGVSILVSYW